MSLTNRSLVTIDDLSDGEIEALFSLADEMADSHKGSGRTMPWEDHGQLVL